MVNGMDYCTIFQVIDTWEMLRRISDYEYIAGTVLFQRLFEKCPETKPLFGFPIDMDPQSEALLKSKRFIAHSSHMVQMLDRAFNMLGPDEELLTEILHDLGKKHARFGVKADYFPFMGESLIEMLQEVLGNNFTGAMQECFVQVFEALSTDMREGMGSEKAVIESWSKLKQMQDYQLVAGRILFQSLFKKCPNTKILFGFPAGMTEESLLKSRRFKMHSVYFIEMLDKALDMVEKDELAKNMENLGKVHAMYGVEKEYFPIMGECLIFMLKETLKDDLTPSCEEAWKEVYLGLSTRIMKAMDMNK